MSGLPTDWSMSAAALATAECCPQMFVYRYTQRVPVSPERTAALAQGDLLHLLAWRRFSGVPVGQGVGVTKLLPWLERLVEAAAIRPGDHCYPELELRLQRADLRLVAKLDLVVARSDGRLEIFDWKTQERLPRRPELLRRPATAIYRFLLSHLGDRYRVPSAALPQPEEISMCYFSPVSGQRVDLPYSAGQLRRDTQMLAERYAWLSRGSGLEPRPDPKVCQRCSYRAWCPAAIGSLGLTGEAFDPGAEPTSLTPEEPVPPLLENA